MDKLASFEMEALLNDMFQATGAKGVVLDEFRRLLRQFGHKKWSEGFDEGFDSADDDCC